MSAVFSDLHIFNILKIILFKILDQLVVWFLLYVNYQHFPIRSKGNVFFSKVLNAELLFQSTNWLPECFRLHVINPIPDLLLHWKLILQVMSSFQKYRLHAWNASVSTLSPPPDPWYATWSDVFFSKVEIYCLKTSHYHITKPPMCCPANAQLLSIVKENWNLFHTNH